MTLPLISMRQITKRFPGVIANNKINLELYPGEIHALLGENGSGKSTLMSILTGLYKPTEGCIMVGGEEVKFASPADAIASGIGMVHQHFKLIESFTVAENIVLSQSKGGFLLKPEQIIADIESLGEKYGLQVDPRAYVWQLGVGEKQRVEILRMLYHRSRVLILDEPTSYLDIRHKLELLTILRKMAKENGITVIMSLHEIDLAQKISDQVICVKGDRIAEFGDPEEIFTEATIRDLYEIDNGYYDPIFGSVELPKPEGEPEVLVLSSGKTGIPVYRKLQKAGIPFAAGILYPGESDYQLARLLASGIISEEPYEPISDETYQKALKIMEKCGKVINAGVKVGSMNQKMGELLRIAEERRMLVSI